MAGSRWSEKGFSLLELMVALAVFVISISVLISAQTAAVRHQANARMNFTAAALMRELLMNAETMGVPGSGEDETEGDFGEDFPGFKWKRKVKDAEIDPGLLAQAGDLGVDLGQVKTVLPGIREVTLEIDWETGGTPGQARLTYYAVSSWAANQASR